MITECTQPHHQQQQGIYKHSQKRRVKTDYFQGPSIYIKVIIYAFP